MTSVTQKKQLPNKDILLVEDDHFILKIYTKWLTAAGANVITANDGAQALRLLNEKHVDLVLLDLGMPGLNGYDTLLEMRKMEKAKDLPVIILSNTTMNENRDGFADLRASGVKDILRKYEVSLSEIVERISSYFPETEQEVI
jgi:two-component system, OmpR family, response regulator